MKAHWMAIASALACLGPLPLQAQVQRSGGDAATRVMQQLQQVTAERATLQNENTRLQQEVAALQAELKQAKAARDAAEAKTRNLQAAAQRPSVDPQAEEQVEKTRAQLQELIAKFRETAQTLRDVEGDRAQVKSQLAQRERDFKVCVDRNVALYELNNEILAKLEDRSFLASFASVEPFTRIARARQENLIEDYRYRAEELKAQRAEKAALTAQP